MTHYTSMAFAPFGEAYAANGTMPKTFTGDTQDTASGIYDFLARKEHTSQGRWLTPDPSGLAAVNIRNPQTWNRYAYVGNNPLMVIDPSGLDGQGATDQIDINMYDLGDFDPIADQEAVDAALTGDMVFYTVAFASGSGGGFGGMTLTDSLDYTEDTGDRTDKVYEAREKPREERERVSDKQMRKENECMGRAFGAAAVAVAQNYVPIPIASAAFAPVPDQSASDAVSDVTSITEDFVSAGGQAVVSVAARKAGFATVADGLDAVPFLGEIVLVGQAAVAAYDGVTAYTDSYDSCMSTP